MYKMIYRTKSPDGGLYDNTDVTLTLKSNHASLDDLVKLFETFLKATGYSLGTRYVDIVEREEASNEVQDA